MARHLWEARLLHNQNYDQLGSALIAAPDRDAARQQAVKLFEGTVGKLANFPKGIGSHVHIQKLARQIDAGGVTVS